LLWQLAAKVVMAEAEETAVEVEEVVAELVVVVYQVPLLQMSIQSFSQAAQPMLLVMALAAQMVPDHYSIILKYSMQGLLSKPQLAMAQCLKLERLQRLKKIQLSVGLIVGLQITDSIKTIIPLMNAS
jgi:hypothetical protein